VRGTWHGLDDRGSPLNASIQVWALPSGPIWVESGHSNRHTPRMSSAGRRLSCFVLAFALFIVRVADAHAHLCFDGKEPPTAIHFGCGGTHACETDKSAGHTGDKDVQVSANLLVKKSVSADSWMPAFGGSIFQYVTPLPDGRISAGAAVVRLPDAGYLRPPLRGPPV
jgi:hypothetical protein